MQQINNVTECSRPPYIALLYLGFLGDTNSKCLVGQEGSFCSFIVPKTVITPQVFDLATQTSNELNLIAFG